MMKSIQSGMRRHFGLENMIPSRSSFSMFERRRKMKFPKTRFAKECDTGIDLETFSRINATSSMQDSFSGTTQTPQKRNGRYGGKAELFVNPSFDEAHKCTRSSKMKVKSCLPSWIVLTLVNLNYVPSTGAKSCEGFGDCVIFSGYTCKNNKCVCDPDEPGFFRCIPPKFYGERCNSDQECQLGDYNLHCLKTDIRICKCKRGYVWDMERKKCLPTLDDDMYSGKFEPVRDLVIPGLIIMTIGAMVYLGFKLFCNCGKLWRRRRHQEIARELEEISAGPHQQAWIASYRVFSPYNNPNRPSSALSPTSFPLHPAPCMGLFVPSQTLSQSPPPYEEALKHKVILSSYHNPGPPVVPVPAYTLPAQEIPRRYQTLPPNASGCSSIILNPNGPNGSTLKYSAHRSFAGTQSDIYPGLPLTNEWTQIPCAGSAGTVRSLHSTATSQEVVAPTEGTDSGPQQRAPSLEVWPQHPRNSQMAVPQPRGTAYRPGQPQKIYHGSDSPRNIRNNERNT